MIQGVKLHTLKVLQDDRGFLMEIMRPDYPIFEKFGQVYMTCVKKGIAKGWHYHKKQDDHFVCVQGRALVALCDKRKNSETKGEVNEFILNEPGISGEKQILKIPKGVYHGFTTYKCKETRIINVPTEKYNYKKPDEFRLPWNTKEIPYSWPKEVKKGG